MNVINLNQYKESMEIKPLTMEDIKQYSNKDLLDHLHECIDWLTQEEQYTDKWNFIRNWIDDLIAILDQRLDTN